MCLSTCPVPPSAIISSLKTITDHCSPTSETGSIYRSLLVTNAAIYTLMNLLGVSPPGEDSTSVLVATLRTLRVLTKESLELKDSFVAHERLNSLLKGESGQCVAKQQIITHNLLTSRFACRVTLQPTLTMPR